MTKQTKNIVFQTVLLFVFFVCGVLGTIAFIMYFTKTPCATSGSTGLSDVAYLQQKLFGKTSNELLTTIEKTLDNSPYWYERFDDFKLSVDHIRNGNQI